MSFCDHSSLLTIGKNRMTGSPRLDYVSQIDLPVQLRVADVETARPTISGQFLQYFEGWSVAEVALTVRIGCF